MNDTSTAMGNIAIVDDDEPLREALGSILKSAGFSIGSFASAEEFLDSPGRDNVACLMLDVRLPGMSGIELQKLLIQEMPLLPIIFLSAHGDASIRELVMQAGASGFLNKPVRRESLLREIREALRSTEVRSHVSRLPAASV